MHYLFKSILHNIGVVFVGIMFALIGVGLDTLFGIHRPISPFLICSGCVFIALGFFIRVWATYYFYVNKLGVIVLHPQRKLLTKGPYRFSRNPLYLGGNIFIFLGATLVAASPMGIFLTFLNIIVINWMIKHEEKQLQKAFGQKWISYTKKVRRWI